jgi:hypothetical protein
MINSSRQQPSSRQPSYIKQSRQPSSRQSSSRQPSSRQSSYIKQSLQTSLPQERVFDDETKTYIHDKNRCYLDLLSNDKNEKIDTTIPKIYKSQINDIFNKYEETNNGVILKDNKFLGKTIKYITKGGGVALNKTNASIPLIDKLTKYCQEVNSPYKHYETDEHDIQDYLLGNRTNQIIIKNDYALVKDFITSNNAVKGAEYKIHYTPRYEYSNCQEIPQQDPPNHLKKSYNCREYNEEIVTAYEKNFFNDDNQVAISEFIEEQKNFIERLDVREKRIIQDYTNDKSFRFYNKYKSSEPTNDSWVDSGKDFGDAFYIQVFELRLQTIIDGKTRQEWMRENRVNKTNQSKIILTKDEWVRVLNQFMMDLDAIIMKAPPVKKPIYCYRGVTSHYIRGGNDVNPVIFSGMPDISTITTHRMKSFVSTRLSSFSLDFNVSNNFFFYSTSTDKSLYRITILPLCKVLYVAQLSVFSNEVEIIAPSNSIFYYNIDNTGNDLTPVLSNNNITKKYGICSPGEESFNSFDSILAFTPQPPTINIDEVKRILNDLNRGPIPETDAFLQEFIKICNFPSMD